MRGRAHDSKPGRRFFVAMGAARYLNLPPEAQLPRVELDLELATQVFGEFGYQRVLPGLGEYTTIERVKETLSHWSKDVELGPSDVLVFYYAGHGIVEHLDRHYLMCWDSRPGHASTALPTEDVMRIFGETRLGNLLMVLDTCHGSAGSADAARIALRALARRAAGGTAKGMWFLASARTLEEAADGAFADVLRHALDVVTERTGQRQRFLDLSDFVGTINALLEKAGLAQRAELACTIVTGLAPFLPNSGFRESLPPVGTDLEIQHRVSDRDLYEHFGPRSRGVEFESEQGLYFNGRTRALTKLVNWLTTARGDGKGRVVTGSPGCGKSAVLGRIVALSDPLYRAVTPLDEVDRCTVVPEGVIGAAVHARHKRLEQVVTQLCAELQADADGAAALLQDLSRRSAANETIAIVVDALDEAGTGTAADSGGHGEPRRIARELLRPMSEIPGVRLLVGTRRELVDSLGPTFHEIDLDDAAYREPDDVSGYVLKVLLAEREPNTKTPYRDMPEIARQVAAEVAGRAKNVFLVARMTARSLRSAADVVDVSEAGWTDRLPTEIGEAFDDYLHRFGPDEARVRRMLAPLAFAEGQGLPRGTVWSQMAARISGVAVSEEDLAWALRVAKPYVAEVVEHSRSAYRLYHQSLAEHLRADPQMDPSTTQSRIVEALTATVPTRSAGDPRDWLNAPPYVRTHLATHAAAAGRLDELVEDPGFLLAADQLPLVRALPAVSSSAARRVRNAYEQVAHRLGGDTSLGERAAYLQLSGRRCGAGELADRIVELGLAPPWSTKWAWWSATGAHRRLIGHKKSVTAVTLGQLDDRLIAVTGSRDKTARIWDLATQRQIGEPLRGEAPVTAVTLGELGEYTVALVGDLSGQVRVWDLSTGQQHGPPLRGHTNAVTSVAMTLVNSASLAVTASADGTARAWDLTTREQAGPPFARHRASVNAVAIGFLAGQLVAVTGGNDNRAHVWDLTTQQPVGEPLVGHTRPISALAVTCIGDRTVVVTGSNDQTVGLWDLASRQQIGEPLVAHPSIYLNRGVRSVAIGTLDGQPVLLTCGHDDAKLWSLSNRQQIGQPLSGHVGTINAAALAASGGPPVAVTVGADAAARVWDLTAEQPTSGHTGSIGSVAICQLDEATIGITGGDDTTARLWDLRSRAELGPPLDGHSGPVTAVALGTLHGRLVAVTGSADTTVRLWAPHTGASIGTALHWHTNVVTAVAIGVLGDREVVFSGSGDGTVRIGDPSTGRQMGEPLSGHRGGIVQLVIGEMGGRPGLNVLCDSGWIYVWTLDGSRPGVTARWSPDSHALNDRPIGVGFIHDNAIALIATTGNAIQPWDVAEDRPFGQPLIGHIDYIISAQMANVGGATLVASASQDRDIRLWDLDESRQIGDPIPFECYAPPQVALGTINRTPVALLSEGTRLRLWDIAAMQAVGEPLSGQSMDVSALALGRLGSRPIVVTGGSDGAIRIHDLATGSQVTPHAIGRGAITSLSLYTDQGRLLAATGRTDGSIETWDLESHRKTATLRGHTDWVRGLLVAPIGDRQVVLSGSDDATLRRWDITETRQIGEPMTGHTAWIHALVLVELNGRTVAASGSGDGTARIWEIANGTAIGPPLTGHSGGVTALAFGTVNNHPILLTGDSEGAVRIWDLALTTPTSHILTSHEDKVTAIVLGTLGGHTVAVSGDTAGTLRVNNLHAYTLVNEVALEVNIQDLAISPSGLLVVATGMGVVALQPNP